MANYHPVKCAKCGGQNFGQWTSSTTGKVSLYCVPCRNKRRETYNERKIKNGGKHTKSQWLIKLAEYAACPRSQRLWNEIPPRPNKRYKYTWTKDHIVSLFKGGSDDISNIQPLCYQCQFRKNAGD
jgi:hypothetical protein